jgi:hypothetical protein
MQNVLRIVRGFDDLRFTGPVVPEGARPIGYEGISARQARPVRPGSRDQNSQRFLGPDRTQPSKRSPLPLLDNDFRESQLLSLGYFVAAPGQLLAK